MSMGNFGMALLTVCQWGVAAFVMGGLLLWIFGEYLDKTLEAWEAAGLMALDIVLLAVAIQLMPTIFYYPFLLGLVGLAYLISYIPQVRSARARRNLWEDDLLRFQRAIDFDPKNVAAYSFMGDTYLKLDDLDNAIESWHKALELQPSLKPEQEKIRKAMREKSIQEATAMYCPRCRQPRAPVHNKCLNCDREFTFDETIKFNMQRLSHAQQMRYLALLIAIGILALLCQSLHLGWLALLVLAGLIAAVVKVLRDLAKWE
jgi:tetratricopeptide (TPR) repeat protein